jgi:hypothetical protein
LKEKVAAPVQKSEITAVGIRHADHVAPSIRKKVGTIFVDKRRSLGWHSSLADSGHGAFFIRGNRKGCAVTGAGNMTDMQGRQTVLLKVLLVHQRPMYMCFVVQKTQLFPAQLFRTFPSHSIPEVTENFDVHFFVYSTPFWNKFSVDQALSVTENLQT